MMLSLENISLIELVHRQANSLFLYQEILEGYVGESFIDLLSILQEDEATPAEYLKAYTTFFKALATENKSWEEYLIDAVIKDENPFSWQAQTVDLHDISQPLIKAVEHDLQILQKLYQCSGEQLSRWVQNACHQDELLIFWADESPSNLETPESAIKAVFQKASNWAEKIEDLAIYYRQHGTGIFAEYGAFRWNREEFVAIENHDAVRLEELTGYEWQKKALLKNTEFFLAGLPALHVLLYGSRGSGKSSLIKALLNAYKNQGLRLIEVAKSDLKDLPIIVDSLRDYLAQKFIIFVDDLSFEEDDDDFKYLKVVLEGSLTARAKNVIVYATSNRRHLIREFFEDRPRPKDNEEIHRWDTVQEKLSFSDRFGLTLTFEPANQETYLSIIYHLAEQEKINLTQEEIEFKALQWATRHNGRSGRTARQFIDFLKSELTMG